MRREISEHLGELSRFERPKKLALLAHEFTIEDGRLYGWGAADDLQGVAISMSRS